MHLYIRLVLTLLVFGLPVAASSQTADPPKVKRVESSTAAYEKLVIGEAEYVRIPVLDAVFKARIDTGATTTSIHATDIEMFERDGKPWARFVVKNPGLKKKYPLEMPVARIAKIKKRGEDGETERPAVELDLTLGEATKPVKVNLADRKGFEYPLLIGRDFLRGLAIVDVSKKYTQKTPGAPVPDKKRGK